ncbi:MAG: S-layer homology domain-containing protein [Oscillospiraceae bacterium]
MYTYEPGKANYSQNYQITLDNASVNAEIPVDEIPVVPTIPFTDVAKDTELYDAVDWAYFSEPQITAGVSATSFAPERTCTRAEIVSFLYRQAGEPDASGVTLSFTDVDEGAYYTDAVKWAVSTGVTAGTSATTFSPNATCTRAQAVTLLYNAAGAPDVSGLTLSFADVAEDTYYADAVKWALSTGITAGTGSTTFSPDAPCTRGQIVVMLYRGEQA